MTVNLYRSLAMLKSMIDKAQLARRATGDPYRTISEEQDAPTPILVDPWSHPRQLARRPTGELTAEGMPTYHEATPPGQATGIPGHAPGEGATQQLKKPFAGPRQLAAPGKQVQFKPLVPSAGASQHAGLLVEAKGHPKHSQQLLRPSEAEPMAKYGQTAQSQPVLPRYGGEGQPLFGGTPTSAQSPAAIGRQAKLAQQQQQGLPPVSTAMREAPTLITSPASPGVPLTTPMTSPDLPRYKKSLLESKQLIEKMFAVA